MRERDIGERLEILEREDERDERYWRERLAILEGEREI